MVVSVIESRTIDGRLYFAADDVCAALRNRASEYRDRAAATTDPEHLLCYHVCATELDARADVIDLAAIEHVTG